MERQSRGIGPHVHPKVLVSIREWSYSRDEGDADAHKATPTASKCPRPSRDG